MCPDCNGTGIYQGLNTVEPCATCSNRTFEVSDVEAPSTGVLVNMTPAWVAASRLNLHWQPEIRDQIGNLGITDENEVDQMIGHVGDVLLHLRETDGIQIPVWTYGWPDPRTGLPSDPASKSIRLAIIRNALTSNRAFDWSATLRHPETTEEDRELILRGISQSAAEAIRLGESLDLEPKIKSVMEDVRSDFRSTRWALFCNFTGDPIEFFRTREKAEARCLEYNYTMTPEQEVALAACDPCERMRGSVCKIEYRFISKE